MRRILFVFGAAVLALALTAPSVAANSPPLEVTIEDTVDIIATGEFAATGPAVDAEVMCPTGTSAVISTIRTDLGRGLALLRIHKTATCDDNSGTFNINMRVFLNDSTGETTARWQFHGGTGEYTGLRGHGELIGIPIVFGESIFDIYTGQLRS